MQIVKDEALIKRRGRIGQWTSLGALGVLGIGMYLSFQQRTDLFPYSIGALILGFTMTQIGMYFSTRFGRSPRPDEKLDAALKGLPGDATLYHYSGPAPHLLVGPMGIWAVLPYHQRGTLTFDGKRWRLRGGGFMQGYMTLFGQEGLGRPDVEAATQVDAVSKFLAKKMDPALIPTVRAVLVFTHDQVELKAEDAPSPAVQIKKLKDFMRQQAKAGAVRSDALARVNAALQEERTA
ncbi:MAG TPA: hypothetical protein VFH29_04010 [Anaerolineales bacterium]|nr:hypothetical protein [Anaerolineales bacterium]